MKLKPEKPGSRNFTEESRLWLLCERIIETLKEEAYHLRSDTLVSIAEAAHNSYLADKLEEFANEIEREI